MARFSGGAKSAGAGSTTLPLMSLYAASAVAAKIREIGVFNTTATAFDVKLTRMTTAGTQGSGLTEAPYDKASVAASSTLVNTHTSTGPTLGDDLGYRASIAGSIGAGVIWTFGDTGLIIPAGTGNGIGVIVENGTGQIAQIYFVWDE